MPPYAGRVSSPDPTALVNLRDLGGLAVRGDRVTRHGVLYRSDAPLDGDLDPEHVAAWPPAQVVDLRMEREAARMSYAWAEGTVVCPLPLHSAAAPDDVRQADLAALYRFILEEVPDRVAAAVDLVTEGPAPTLVHCTAGKDRTGIVVAALLLAADVEPEAVVADYAQTEQNMDGVIRRMSRLGSGDHPVNPAWLEAPEEAIREVVDHLHATEAGGAFGWLVGHGASEERLEDWVSGFVTTS